MNIIESDSRAARDPVRPIAYYHAFVAQEQEAIRAYTKYNNPALFFSVSPKCVRIARALYSAGAEVAECQHWFGEAASYQRRFLVEGKQFKLGSPGNIDDYLELYSAALLANQSEELIAALKRCEYTQAALPGTNRLLTQFCDLLQGRPVETSAAQVAELQSIKKEWACLPVLFNAVSTKAVAPATTALEDYLANSWGPETEKWARYALKSPTPDYCGKWSIFSAAACKLLGTAPELGKKAKRYLPIDLGSV